MKIVLAAIVALVFMAVLDLIDYGLIRYQAEWFSIVLNHSIYRASGILAFVGVMIASGQFKRS